MEGWNHYKFFFRIDVLYLLDAHADNFGLLNVVVNRQVSVQKFNPIFFQSTHAALYQAGFPSFLGSTNLYASVIHMEPFSLLHAKCGSFGGVLLVQVSACEWWFNCPCWLTPCSCIEGSIGNSPRDRKAMGWLRMSLCCLPIERK